MRKPAAIGLVIAIAACILIAGYCFGEPRHGGRTLTSWLERYWDAPDSDTNQIAEAQAAIRAIGGQQAIPTLLKLASAKDSPAKTWLMEKAENSRLQWPHWRSATTLQFEGILGFETLGSNAAPAVDALSKLLDDQDLAFVAVRCLDAISKPAEFALCRALTNQDPQVRGVSVSALSSATEDVEVYLARIKPRLRDVAFSVRLETVAAIGYQRDTPELAIPLLIPALEDPDDAVAAHAAGELAGFGTNAAIAFAPLTNLVNVGRPAQSRAALKALPAIAPVESLPVLSNSVVSGSSEVLGAALTSLKTIAPEQALAMTLATFQSPDPRRRLQVVNVAASYDTSTPGISGLLKSAAADISPEVAQRAAGVISRILDKRREAPGYYVHIANEPIYQGKSLGEWLSLKQVGGASAGELSTNALEALRQMGTNAVPALCMRLDYRDPVFGVTDFEVSGGAMKALIALGDEAKPALPALTAMMDCDDRNLALRAMVATIGTGSNALPCLMKGLTNQFPDVRNEAASFLAGEWGASFPEQRKQVIPFLVEFLSDSDESVRQNATNELLELDPATAAKVNVTARPNLHPDHVQRK